MSANKGYQVSPEFSDKEVRTEVFQTYQKSNQGRGNADIIQHGVFPLEVIAATAIVKNVITLPANNAVRGHILQNKTSGLEFNIVKVYGDEITIEQTANIGMVGDLFAVKQFVMSQLNKDGAMEVVASQGPLQFVKDAAAVEVTEVTATPANSIPLPVKVLDDAGINADLREVRTVIHNNCTDTPITEVGVIIGAITKTAKEIQVSNNANDILIEVAGTVICASLAGSPFKINVKMDIGNVVVKSLSGGSISGGSIAINITG